MPGASRFTGIFETTVGSTMRPGDPGTAKLVRDWRDRLVSVRYRYAASPPTRFTTVEIVVDAAPWKPAPGRSVLVEVKSWESDLRKKVSEAGGRWEARAGRWRIRYDRAAALGLEDRVQLTITRARKTSTAVGTRISPPRPKSRGKLGRNT